MQTVIIAGATGLIGQALSLSLNRHGHRVIALARNVAEARQRLGADNTILAWDDPSAWQAAIAQADVVINLAGAPILPHPWTANRRHVLQSSRIDTTQALVDAIGQSDDPPKLLIQASATGFYGAGSSSASEQTAVGRGFAAQLCSDWEQTADQALSDRTRVIRLRIGNVLARESGLLGKIGAIYRAHLASRLGSGRQPFSWIDLDDLLAIIHRCIADQTLNGAINACVPTQACFADLHQALRAKTGRQFAPPAPAWLVETLLGEAGQLLTRGRHVIPERLCHAGFEWRFSNLANCVAHHLQPSSRVHFETSQDVTPQGKRASYCLQATTQTYSDKNSLVPWFETPLNLGVMTPNFMRFSLQGEPQKMAEGAVIHYRIYLFGFPMTWVTRIEQWEAGESFVDQQAKGPYSLWWHEHRFEEQTGNTEIHDRVLYRMPLGWIGRLVHRLFIRRTLSRIFAYRMAVVDRRFGQKTE